MDNALRLIGIAKKAGRLEVGEEPVGAAARARQAKLLVLAADAADNTLRRAGHFAEAGNVRLVQSPYSKAELGAAVGRSSCAMLALTDAGLAASFAAKLAAADPERYGEDAQTLSQKAEKVLERQKEQRRHEKNLLKAKAKPWAAPQKSGAERRLAEKSGEGKAREERVSPSVSRSAADSSLVRGSQGRGDAPSVRRDAADSSPKGGAERLQHGGKVREERSAPSVRRGAADSSPKGGAERLQHGGKVREERDAPSVRGAKAHGAGKSGGPGRSSAPSHRKKQNGPGTGTNRNGGRQVT